MIFYFGSINPHTPYQNIWTEQIPQMLQDRGYRTEVLSGNTEVPTIDRKYWQMSDNLHMFDRIYEKLVMKRIKKNDFIIFSDAWNPSAVAVRTLLKREKMRCKMVGMWQDSIYNVAGELLHMVDHRRSNWIKMQEHTLYKTYDHNVFFVKFFMRKKFSHLFAGTKWYFSTYPSGRVYEEAVFDIDQKQNIIILATDMDDVDGLNMLHLLQHAYPEYHFEYAAVRTMTREVYTELLKKSKVIINAIMGDAHFYNAYEAMHYGCIPMVIDSAASRKFFPDELRMPEWFIEPPIVNFIRSNGEVDAMIYNIIYNYNDSLRHIDFALEQFQLKFNNDIFFKNLENILNFNTHERYRRNTDNGLYTEYKLEECRDTKLRKMWRKNLRPSFSSEES